MKPVHASLDAPCPAGELFHWVEELDRYPPWLDLVQRVTPTDSGGWVVVLGARLGPFRRSKQLTMVRTRHEPGRSVRFERREPDGRDHAAWVLEATVAPTAEGSTLAMTLSYDGQLFGPVVERVLTDEIEAARPRLLALVTADRPR